jgi:capsular polysaccharide biosynthesis protein/Mrp family chromosome partitioning ATPase
MELNDIFSLLKKHIWVLVIGCFLGILLGLLYSVINPYDYSATSKILISRNTTDKNSDYGYLTDLELSQTYATLLKTKPILDAASEKIDYKIDIKDVTILPIVDSLIIQISAKNQNPQTAADIANAFADVLIDQNSSLQASRYSKEIDSLNTQIKNIETQIGVLSSVYNDQIRQLIAQIDSEIEKYIAELIALQQDIAEINVPPSSEERRILAEKNTKVNEIQPLLTLYQQMRTNLEYIGHPYQTGSGEGTLTLTQIKNSVDEYQKIYVSLLNNLEETKLLQLQNTPSVIKIEAATKPKNPSYPTFLLNPVILGFVGLILAILFCVLKQYFDNPLQYPEQINGLLGLRFLGSYQKLPWKKEDTFLLNTSNKSNNTSIINIRSSIELLKINQPIKSLLITSFFENDGKSIFSYNLGLSYAMGNEKVVLIDANLEHPEIQNYFDIKNDFGLNDILFGDHEFNSYDLNQTNLDCLKILPAGNPLSLLDHLLKPQKIFNILDVLEKENDVIIFDCPSISEANLRILSSVVDCIIILLQPGQITADEVKNLLFNLNLPVNKIVGIVINDSQEINFYTGGKKVDDKKHFSGIFKEIILAIQVKIFNYPPKKTIINSKKFEENFPSINVDPFIRKE